MTAKHDTVETVDNPTVKTSVSRQDKVQDVSELCGYIAAKEALNILKPYYVSRRGEGKKRSEELTITTLNNWAYNGKIEAIRIGGIHLFLKEGDNSVQAFIPVLQQENEARAKNKSTLDARDAQKTFMKEVRLRVAKIVDDNIKNGVSSDIDTIRKQVMRELSQE